MILLALFNDVTMIPVAEDNQTAAAEPQHAMIGHLIGFSMTLGVFQSALGLSGFSFVFGLVRVYVLVLFLFCLGRWVGGFLKNHRMNAFLLTDIFRISLRLATSIVMCHDAQCHCFRFLGCQLMPQAF